MNTHKLNFNFLNRVSGLGVALIPNGTCRIIESFRSYHTHERALMNADAECFHKTKNELNEFKIYYTVRKYFECDPRFRSIPLEDLLQEIRLAMLESTDTKQYPHKLSCKYSVKVLRRARHNIRCLLRQMKNSGAGIICSYTHADIEQFHAQEAQEASPLANEILDYYEAHTVKETCAQFNIPNQKAARRAFNRYFPKNCGHGGRRQNSGKRKEATNENSCARSGGQQTLHSMI